MGVLPYSSCDRRLLDDFFSYNYDLLFKTSLRCRSIGKASEGQQAGFAEYIERTPAFIPDLRKLWAKSLPSVADNEAFVSLVQLAREDGDIRRWVLALAELEDLDRQTMLHDKIEELRSQNVARRTHSFIREPGTEKCCFKASEDAHRLRVGWLG